MRQNFNTQSTNNYVFHYVNIAVLVPIPLIVFSFFYKCSPDFNIRNPIDPKLLWITSYSSNKTFDSFACKVLCTTVQTLSVPTVWSAFMDPSFFGPNFAFPSSKPSFIQYHPSNSANEPLNTDCSHLVTLARFLSSMWLQKGFSGKIPSSVMVLLNITPQLFCSEVLNWSCVARLIVAFLCFENLRLNWNISTTSKTFIMSKMAC